MRRQIRWAFRLSRAHGLRWTLRTLWRRFGFAYQRLWVFYVPLELRHCAADPDDIVFRLGTADDFDDLDASFGSSGYPRERFAYWLETGGWLFLACHGAQPVAFNHLTPISLVPELSLSPHQVFAGMVFVLPAYRRRHITRRLWDFRSRQLHTWGYTEEVGTVNDTNYPSLLATYNNGAVRQVKRLTRLQILGVHRHWLVPDAGSRLQAHLDRLAPQR